MDLCKLKINKQYLIFFLFLLYSCSIFKERSKVIDNSNTSGFTLNFVFQKHGKGVLYINKKEDSIFFQYRVDKIKKEVITDKDTKVNKKFYVYNIKYLENKELKYNILKKYTQLLSLDKLSKITYKPARSDLQSGIIK